MFKSNFKSIAVLIVVSLFFGSLSAFAADSSDMQDFSVKKCKDVMRMSGRDRDIALAFVHGYRLGKMGKTQYSVDALAQITDKFTEHCLDNPGDNALQSFEKVAK